MKRALVVLVVVAIAGLIAASYICALQVAASDRPSLTPAEQEKCLQATQESRTVAGQRAVEGKRKRHSAYIKLKYKPSRDAMAARTAGDHGGDMERDAGAREHGCRVDPRAAGSSSIPVIARVQRHAGEHTD